MNNVSLIIEGLLSNRREQDNYKRMQEDIDFAKRKLKGFKEDKKFSNVLVGKYFEINFVFTVYDKFFDKDATHIIHKETNSTDFNIKDLSVEERKEYEKIISVLNLLETYDETKREEYDYLR